MFVQIQRSSEKAFHIFGETSQFLEEAFRFAEEPFRFAVQAAPQTHFRKMFRMLVSFFLLRTIKHIECSDVLYS